MELHVLNIERVTIEIETTSLTI